MVDRSLASSGDLAIGTTGVVYRGCCGPECGATGVMADSTKSKGVDLVNTAVISGLCTRGDRHEAGDETVD